MAWFKRRSLASPKMNRVNSPLPGGGRRGNHVEAVFSPVAVENGSFPGEMGRRVFKEIRFGHKPPENGLLTTE